LITTAGQNISGICYEQRTYITKILDGSFEDDTYFGIIYTIDEDDDWTDPVIWEKANPNYGISVQPDDLARLAKKAEQLPSAQSNFLRKRLNVWVGADDPWMNKLEWNKCAVPELKMEDFKYDPCFIGIDLASKIDITAMMFLFERQGNYYAFGKYYLPEERIKISPNSQYEGWVRAGALIATPGTMTDFDYVEHDLIDVVKRFDVRDIAIDPFQATQFITRMEKIGLVLDGRFFHNGDPVLSWMASNVIRHPDKKDNIYPNKENPENKIDGVIGLLMALNREIRHREDTSVYEEKGMTVVGGGDNEGDWDNL
jgi:phage terminase large subunit-like protein